MRRFEGKYCLVTGAGSGIGQATAMRLAQEGAAVACVDLDGSAAESTAAGIAESGARADALTCDISNETAVEACIESVMSSFGHLDVLCNIAGILRADHTHELSLENWQKIINVNLTGTFLMCRAAIPHLLERKGAIINMASTAALGSHPWMSAYAASKGGILALTRALSIEYIKQGLKVNAVCPGGIATPLHGQFRMPKNADGELLKGAIPFMRYAGPEQVAAYVAFLGSSDSDYIHGTELRVDGGALS